MGFVVIDHRRVISRSGARKSTAIASATFVLVAICAAGLESDAGLGMQSDLRLHARTHSKAFLIRPGSGSIFEAVLYIMANSNSFSKRRFFGPLFTAQIFVVPSFGRREIFKREFSQSLQVRIKYVDPGALVHEVLQFRKHQ
jgi:hypothetical protein